MAIEVVCLWAIPKPLGLPLAFPQQGHYLCLYLFEASSNVGGPPAISDIKELTGTTLVCLGRQVLPRLHQATKRGAFWLDRARGASFFVTSTGLFPCTQLFFGHGLITITESGLVPPYPQIRSFLPNDGLPRLLGVASPGVSRGVARPGLPFVTIVPSPPSVRLPDR